MEAWPELPLEQWEDTRATLHMWTQIVGKVRLEQTPLVNHYWNVPLYVSARGLTTTAMPYEDRFFEMEFDFVDHFLVIRCSDAQMWRWSRSLSRCCTGKRWRRCAVLVSK
jgi:hypothetical protein